MNSVSVAWVGGWERRQEPACVFDCFVFRDLRPDAYLAEVFKWFGRTDIVSVYVVHSTGVVLWKWFAR